MVPVLDELRRRRELPHAQDRDHGRRVRPASGGPRPRGAVLQRGGCVRGANRLRVLGLGHVERLLRFLRRHHAPLAPHRHLRPRQWRVLQGRPQGDCTVQHGARGKLRAEAPGRLRLQRVGGLERVHQLLQRRDAAPLSHLRAPASRGWRPVRGRPLGGAGVRPQQLLARPSGLQARRVAGVERVRQVQRPEEALPRCPAVRVGRRHELRSPGH
mmetsp:Transcript_93569/g.209519  ORF Transcript_93569/g.209519 Transcript_93569/m.209519 type:complete len:214 (+) Transcript_93569:3642-4283(+)